MKAKIIPESRTVTPFADGHRAEAFNDLTAAGVWLGLLINLSSYPRVKHRRIVL